MKGLSTNRRCSGSADCLKANGIEFVIRYYSETTQQPQKHLLPGEAAAVDRAGILLAVVYQDRQDQVEDFTNNAGLRDGKFAFQYARETGQPEGTTIFFAVDYDAEPAHLATIKEYFQGVTDGLAAASGKPNAYQVGVYGSGLVCKTLKSANLVVHTWLSESTGHRESATYKGWTVKQFITNEALCQLPKKSWQHCESKGSDLSWAFSPAVTDHPKPPTPAISESVLRRGDSGPSVVLLQRFLNRWLSGEGSGLILEDGQFGPRTFAAVQAFQASNIDAFGRPLTVDGIAGQLTLGALQRMTSAQADPPSSPLILPGASSTWWKKMPDVPSASQRGREALAIAVREAAAGRGESGGNNLGPDVNKYLNGIIEPPANWCAAFVSYCLKESGPMPFAYTLGARSLLTKAKSAGLTTFTDPFATPPEPGDIIVWWRVKVSSWEGHTGFVHHVNQGRLYTIEGNKTSRVEGFDYPLVGMEKLLGFIRLG